MTSFHIDNQSGGVFNNVGGDQHVSGDQTWTGAANEDVTAALRDLRSAPADGGRAARDGQREPRHPLQTLAAWLGTAGAGRPAGAVGPRLRLGTRAPGTPDQPDDSVGGISRVPVLLLLVRTGA